MRRWTIVVAALVVAALVVVGIVVSIDIGRNDAEKRFVAAARSFPGVDFGEVSDVQLADAADFACDGPRGEMTQDEFVASQGVNAAAAADPDQYLINAEAMFAASRSEVCP
jgi:hypothetical protein